MQVMTPQAPLQDFRQLKLLHQTAEQRDVINAFVLQLEVVWYHTSYLTEFVLTDMPFRER